MHKLYFGDSLSILREHVASESVDLIYLDPPFNSKRDYSVLFKTPKGHESDAQITAFEDRWHWGEQAEREFNDLEQCGTSGLTTSGGPVTTAGTITLGGTLALANGGTGATTQSGAINNVLPLQTGNNGKVLQNKKYLCARSTIFQRSTFGISN